MNLRGEWALILVGFVLVLAAWAAPDRPTTWALAVPGTVLSLVMAVRAARRLQRLRREERGSQ
jgi:hypothetical protein